MRAEHVVQLDSLAVTVRELTLGEVRAWAHRVDAGLVEIDVIASGIVPDCELTDLFEMSSLTAAQADELTAAEINRVADVARKLNPHFFAYRTALTGAVRAMQAELQQTRSSSTPQSS